MRRPDGALAHPPNARTPRHSISIIRGEQLARIEAVGDRTAAMQRLGAAMPLLERIREDVHPDVWQDDVWQRALELRRTLAERR